ncbi:MAG: hypothetical protein J2P37_22255, partial [Ktedonobacteraceae bacterium]|nr:hypothetical protein [Ktedonobacteraceae bacterium]
KSALSCLILRGTIPSDITTTTNLPMLYDSTEMLSKDLFGLYVEQKNVCSTLPRFRARHIGQSRLPGKTKNAQPIYPNLTIMGYNVGYETERQVFYFIYRET